MRQVLGPISTLQLARSSDRRATLVSDPDLTQRTEGTKERGNNPAPLCIQNRKAQIYFASKDFRDH